MLRRDLLKVMAAAGTAGMAPAVLAQSGAVIVSRIGLLDGRVVMPVTIGGRGPFLFLLDTGGATSMIEPALAQELDLRPTGNVRVSGVGGNTAMPTFSARDVVFGSGARQMEVSLAGMTEGFGSRRVRGTLAAGMLTARDSDLDIEAGEWRLYPDGRADRAGFVEVPNAIRGHHRGGRNLASPLLHGPIAVNGTSFDCILDTGAPGAISLGYNAARRLGLWNDARPFAPQASSGVGGSGGIGRIVRVNRAEFGGTAFDRPLVLLRGPEDGTRWDTDGIVGLGMLRGFNLSTEVRRRTLWLQRHADAAPLPDRYGLSGLWLDRAGELAVTVAAVGTGSPAAAAGLRVGDRIEGLTFAEAIGRITRGPGTEVVLPLVRAGTPQPVRFTLQPFL